LSLNIYITFQIPRLGLHFLFQNSSFQISIKVDVSLLFQEALLLFARYQTTKNLQTYVFLRHLLVKTSKVIF